VPSQPRLDPVDMLVMTEQDIWFRAPHDERENQVKGVVVDVGNVEGKLKLWQCLAHEVCAHMNGIPYSDPTAFSCCNVDLTIR
jgi:hypothetical protein